MFYNNNLGLKNITYKKYNLTSFANGINPNIDEQLLPLTTAVTTYNLNFNNGALKTGMGVKPLSISYSFENKNLKKTLNKISGVDFLGMWEYSRWNSAMNRFEKYLLAYGNDGYMYQAYLYFDYTNFIKLTALHFDSMPNVVSYYLNGLDVALISTNTNGMWVWSPEKTPYKVSNAPKITSMCLHYERLFATISGDNRTIWFSDDLDPTNWNVSLSEGGFISLYDERGGANKIVSFKDHLYVFREFGISRITAYANQENFCVAHLFTSSERVYDKTIVICGNNILFLANDGIYSFDGSSTIKLNLKLEKLLKNIKNENAVGAYFNGKYYLALKLNYGDDRIINCESEDDYVNNAMIELDLKTGNVNFMRGIDIRNLSPVVTELDSALICLIKLADEISITQYCDDCGKYIANNTNKGWVSPKTSFGYPLKQKLIKSITLVTKYDVDIILNLDGKKTTFKLKGKELPQTIYPNLKGYLFGIEFFTTTAEAYITNPSIVVGIL